MNLIFGLCSGYNFAILKPLIKSLRNTSFKGDIVLFVSNISEATKKALSDHNVILIEYVDTFPYFVKDPELQKWLPDELKGKYLSPNSLRYVFYQAFLLANKGKYSWILHTDTRDVIFQGDPFAYYKEPGVYCFLEDANFRIKDNKHNTYWIKHGFGEEVFAQMANEPISCSGVTLGSEEAFLYYLDRIVAYICLLTNTGGLDQGIHNYLIFTNQITDLHLIADDEGPVTTLTTFKPYSAIKFSDRGELINKKGEVLPIVHQYDRHLSLLWKFNKHAFFDKLKSLAKRRILVAIGRKLDE